MIRKCTEEITQKTIKHEEMLTLSVIGEMQIKTMTSITLYLLLWQKFENNVMPSVPTIADWTKD